MQEDDNQLNENTIVANNPISSSSEEEAVSEDVQHDNGIDHFEEVLIHPDVDDQSTNTPPPVNNEIERYGFIHPAAPRHIALTVRGSDPCECLDVYDDIYGFLVQNEVRFNITVNSKTSSFTSNDLLFFIWNLNCSRSLWPRTILLCKQTCPRAYVPCLWTG